MLPLLCAQGCGSGAAPREPGAQAGTWSGPITPIEPRIDALPGRTLIIPVRINESDVPRSFELKLSDGRALPAELRRIVVSPSEPSAWLPPAGAWSSMKATDPVESAGVLQAWVISTDLPQSVAGQKITLNGRELPINWLTFSRGPGVISPPAGKVLREVPLPAGPDAPSLARILEPERTSPLRRWRYRLATDGLDRAGGADATPLLLRFSDPAIEAYAVQWEDRWAVALKSLYRSNEALGVRLANRLASIASFGEGVEAPVWQTDQSDLDSLLSDLLNPSFDGARRAQRAEAWLESQPAAAAWVIDDAGTQRALGGEAIVTVGMINLTERPTLASLSPARQRFEGELTPLKPNTATVLRLPDARSVSERALGAAELEARIGSWTRSLRAITGLAPVSPPGLAIGPFESDHTLASLTAGAAPPADPGWSTAGLLFRRSGSDSGAGAWTLHIECLRPDDPGATGEDTLRLWVGLTGRPRLVVRIGESGYSHVELARRREEPERVPSSVRVDARTISSAGKWTCQVTIPGWCVENDGSLRIGLERTDARAVRSTFPRAMLPWQNEPGRIAVDTRGWGSLGGGPER